MEGPAVYLPVLGFVAAQLIINCIVCLLVIVVVGLRIVCRRMGPGIGWDDWFVIFATVCTYLTSPKNDAILSPDLTFA